MWPFLTLQISIGILKPSSPKFAREEAPPAAIAEEAGDREGGALRTCGSRTFVADILKTPVFWLHFQTDCICECILYYIITLTFKKRVHPSLRCTLAHPCKVVVRIRSNLCILLWYVVESGWVFLPLCSPAWRRKSKARNWDGTRLDDVSVMRVRMAMQWLALLFRHSKGCMHTMIFQCV